MMKGNEKMSLFVKLMNIIYYKFILGGKNKNAKQMYALLLYEQQHDEYVKSL